MSRSDKCSCQTALKGEEGPHSPYCELECDLGTIYLQHADKDNTLKMVGQGDKSKYYVDGTHL
jgi:hypothetical protein